MAHYTDGKSGREKNQQSKKSRFNQEQSHHSLKSQMRTDIRANNKEEPAPQWLEGEDEMIEERMSED